MPLPNGYTRLEYIQSTGSQYIDTGFKPNQNTRLVLDFENTGDYSSMTSGLCPLFGARNASSASSASAFGLWIGSKSYPHYGNVAYNANGNFTLDINARLTYEMNKNVVSIGSEVITCSSATFTTNYNLCLLTFNNYGTVETRRASGKLWAAKIYDNGTLVRDFVPCKNSSGAVGLYDLVNKVFYSDAAGGTFTAGAELIPSHKIVDSTLLDAAITATADAIRAKSGKSDNILWGETSGFASAVSAISGGSTAKLQSKTATPSASSQTIKPDSGYDGLSQVTVAAIPSTYKRVATGTFTGTSGLKSYPISVTGLGFTPTRVIAYVSLDGSLGSVDIIYCIDGNGTTTKVTSIEAGYYCEECENYSYSANTASDTDVSMTMFSGGFRISATSNFPHIGYDAEYCYIAIE